MGKCSYCDVEAKMTKEHIWSSGVLRVFDAVAPLTFDDDRNLVHGHDPVVKDLCAACNNGLSDADSEAIRFTSGALAGRLVLGTNLSCASDLLKLWALKTASNCERAHPRGGDWWKDYKATLRGLAPIPSTVVTAFAAWEDRSLHEIASMFGQVRELMAMSGMFLGTQTMDADALQRRFDRVWVLKVGFGVFGVFVVRSGDRDPASAEQALMAEIAPWGWQLVADNMTVQSIPFSARTSGFPGLLAPPALSDEMIVATIRAARFRREHAF